MLACACKWSNPSFFDLDEMEHYADLSGKALRKKSEQSIDETDFFAACLLAIAHSWSGQNGKVEIHLKGAVAILSIIFRKVGGKQRFVSSLGSHSSIFFFLYDIALYALLRLLPLSPQASLEFSSEFSSIAGHVSYEEREGYHYALQLCPPRNHFTPWPTFLTIWQYYQSLLRAWELTYEHPTFPIPSAVQLLVHEIKSDLESPELLDAITQIRNLLLIGPERHDFSPKGARMRVVLLLYQSCCLFLSLLTESNCIAEALHNSEAAWSRARSICHLIHDGMLHERPLRFVSRPTSSLLAIFPDDIVFRIIPIIALLIPNGHGLVSCEASLPDVACLIGDEEAISQSSHSGGNSWDLSELLQRFSGRKDVSYAEECNWEYPWFR